jgi:hypothetical protein
MQAFADETAAPDFIRTVRYAQDGDPDAQEMIRKRMRPHVAIAAAQIPNGPTNRAKAVANIFALTYELGLPSMYLTVSPDYIHTAAAIRASIPEGSTPFPLDDFFTALEESGTFNAPGWTSLDLGTHALNQRMPRNPVAAAETFVSRLNAVLEHLLQCPAASNNRKTPARWRTCGVFGTPYGFYCVVEAQGRGALHYHLLYWGSYSPHVLTQALADPAFAGRILTALAGQADAELPRELHVERLRNRGLAAAGLHNVQPVRGSRLSRQLTANVIAIRDLARKTASQTNVHKHSETCHHGKAGEYWCRMAKPDRPCNSAVVTATLVSKETSTRVIPPPNPECTSRRDLMLYPLEAIDHRCIVVEHPRRRDDTPLAEHERSNLPARTLQWVSQMLPLQNMLISSFNRAIMACEPANQACCQLTCVNAAKQTTYYCADYFKKDSNKLSVSASVFIAAKKHVDTYPSVAPNSGTAIRTAQHMLTNTVNRIVGAMEQSNQQAAMTALGHSADISSATFWVCYVGAAVKHVQSQRPPSSVPAALDEDEANDDGPDAPQAPAGIGGAAGEFLEELEMENVVLHVSASEGGRLYTEGDRVHPVSQHTHYALRGTELATFSLHDYCRLIAVKPVAEVTRDKVDAPGRKCNGKFKFDESHPLHQSHVQVMRSKVTTVRPCPPPPRMPEFSTPPPFAAGPKARQAENAAAYFTVLFRPWSAYDMPDTSYVAWRDWCVGLSVTPTAINKYRLAVMTRMSQGMATRADNLKASKFYRFQCARRWGTTGIDGTEPPPGRSAVADDDDSGVERVVSEDALRAVEQLNRLANPDRTHAQSMTKHNKHVAYVTACSSALGTKLPPVRSVAASLSRPLSSDVLMWKTMSALTDATTDALNTGISADSGVVNSTEPGRPVPVAEINWPSMGTLSPSQRIAVETIRPHIQSRSAPNHAYVVIGGPGTGKSFFIEHIDACCVAAGAVIGHFGLRSGAYAAAAGMVLPQGQTLHSLVGLTTRGKRGDDDDETVLNVFPPPPSAEMLRKLRASWKGVGALIIDEISMVSRPLLGCVSHRLSLILNNEADFGGLLVVLSGDFLQLPPIPPPSMAAASVQPHFAKPAGTPIALADEIFKKVYLLPFVEQKRCDDAAWNTVLDDIRSSGTLRALVPALKVLSAEEVACDPEWSFATIATTGNDVRAVINSYQSSRWVAHKGLVKLRWRTPVHNWDGLPPDPHEADETARTDVRLWQEFVPGLEVSLCQNINAEVTSKGVANGRHCTLYGVTYSDATSQELMLQQLSNAMPGDVVTLTTPPDCVLVDLGNVRGLDDTASLPRNPATGGVLMSLKTDCIDKFQCVIDGVLRKLRVKRFPYDFLFCVTFHKLQGMTLIRLLLDLSYPVYMPFHSFELISVAASRVRQGAHVRVIAPGWGHISELTVNPATVAWRAGFDDAGGFWNKQRAVEAFAVAAAADAPRRRRGSSAASSVAPAGQEQPCAGSGGDSTRGGRGEKRACPGDGGRGQKRACPARAALCSRVSASASSPT